MLQPSSNSMSRLCLQAGGCLQHALGLRSLLDGSSSSSSSSSSSLISDHGQTNGRSISTTRSIYMGRPFVRENLVKGSAKSSLFTRDNYKHLVNKGWSLSACEQVLLKHQRAHTPQNKPAVMSALILSFQSATSLADLQQIVADQGHNMNVVTRSVLIQQVPRVLLNSQGDADYAAAAVLLDHMAQQLLPDLHLLSGSNTCHNMAAFARCRYSPSSELLQAMCQELLADGARKLRSAQLPMLAQLMSALVRLVQPEGNWPVMQAVLQEVTLQLQELVQMQKEEAHRQQQMQVRLQGHLDQLSQQQQDEAAAASEEHERQLAADSAAFGHGSSGSRRAVTPAAAAAAAERAAGPPFPVSSAQVGRRAAAVSYLAFSLDRNDLHTPEYLAALHTWVAQPESLKYVTPKAVVQLWSAFRGQFTRRAGITGGDTGRADSGSSGSSTSNNGSSAHDAGEVELLAADGDAAAAQEAAAAAAAAASAASAAGAGDGAVPSLQQQQLLLRQYFGPGALNELAVATASRMSSLTEQELGQILFYVATLRYQHPELLAAASAAVQRLHSVSPLRPATAMAAAWAAVQLEQPSSEMLQPVLLAAVQQPGGFDGVMVGRLLKVTAALPEALRQEQQQLLWQELHRLSGQRGPMPEEGPGNPAWVTAVSDDVAQRLQDLKPREIAHILYSFASIPGVSLHEGLFGAAARHIEAHAHMFTKFLDMEMVANAFEKMNFKEGLPALKALQEQTQHLV